jgi:hypothetical protein
MGRRCVVGEDVQHGGIVGIILEDKHDASGIISLAVEAALGYLLLACGVAAHPYTFAALD